MTSDGIDYAGDVARFNPKHPHAFLFRVERPDAFKLLRLRTAATYADILHCFEAGLQELKNCCHTRKRQSCPRCGKRSADSNRIKVWYYVMTKSEVLFERHCYVRSIERAVERVESGIESLKALVAMERMYCEVCGSPKPDPRR